MAEFIKKGFRLPVHHVPGDGKDILQLPEELPALPDLIHQLKGTEGSRIRISLPLRKAVFRALLLSRRIKHLEVFEIVDDIKNHGGGISRPQGGKGSADLLFEDDGRHGRPEKDNPGQILHMDALVEHIDTKQEPQMIAPVLPESPVIPPGGRAAGPDAVRMRLIIHLPEPG